MILIRPYQPSDAVAWDLFVLNHPDGTLFHLTAWKRVVSESFGHRDHYLVAEESKGSARPRRIVGVLPLFSIRSPLFGNYMSSVPFAEKGGALAETPEVAERLIFEAARMVRLQGLDYLELRHEKPFGNLPTKHRYVTFRKQMHSDPEKNLQAIPRKSRRMVRVGIKAGLVSRTGRDLLPTFYSLLATNFHRLGTPIFSYRYFQKLVDTFKDSCEIRIIYTPEGLPIAGVLSFFYKDVVMPYYAGSLAEYRHLAPNDFMYFDLMRWSCSHGYRWFDFGRSKIDTGSYAFKIHWGFEPKPLAYQYVLSRIEDIPDLSPANPKYQRKIELWRRLPHWLTRLAGPPIARFLA
ncbi:MAG: FemAB family XrtA/PEP-CTERM system-associated protein [Desulfosoma sp.]